MRATHISSKKSLLKCEPDMATARDSKGSDRVAVCPPGPAGSLPSDRYRQHTRERGRRSSTNAPSETRVRRALRERTRVFDC